MKNSYMNKNNILSEGFFDNVKELFNLYKKIKKNKKISKDPEVKAALKDWDKAADKALNSVNKARARYGLPPV